MKMSIILTMLIIFVGLFCFCDISFGDIFKYVDEDGVIHLTPVPSDPKRKYTLIMKEKRILSSKKKYISSPKKKPILSSKKESMSSSKKNDKMVYDKSYR